jgi:hypothetical protein
MAVILRVISGVISACAAGQRHIPDAPVYAL